MEFDRDKYKVYNWKSAGALFWVLNPLTFLLELGFGQRRPRLVVVDKTLPGPETERSVVPCPYCGKLHDVRTWSWQFSTLWKNWFGLYCNHCGGVIPCLLSLSSYIILLVTFPLWTWFKKSSKERWLKVQPARFRNLEEQYREDPYGERRWLSQAGWRAGSFAAVVGVFLPLAGGDEFSWSRLIISMMAGAAIAFCMSGSPREGRAN